LAVLEVAHARGIVHRDIKPENVFLTATGGLKVLDFGIARLRGMGSGTMRGIVLGTPGFTAPEQARGEWDIVGARTDIWAVGATLFALLTGKLVHEEEQTAAHLLRVSMEPAPPVRQIDPSVPEAVARAIDCALSFSPDLRFGSAEEMRQSIASAYRLTTGQSMGGRRPETEVTSAAYAPTLRVTTGTTVITRRSTAPARGGINRWDALAMAAAFFVLGGTVVGFLATRQTPAAAGDEAAIAAPAAAPATPPTSIATASESPSGARLGAEALAAESAAPRMPPAPEPPPAGLAAPLATAASAPALATAQGPARPRSDRRAVATPPRALTNTEGVPDLQAPVVPIPVTALPPAAPPASATRRPPRASGDNFDFVENRR
jgi:serine/threonine-protein kinase